MLCTQQDGKLCLRSHMIPYLRTFVNRIATKATDYQRESKPTLSLSDRAETKRDVSGQPLAGPSQETKTATQVAHPTPGEVHSTIERSRINAQGDLISTKEPEPREVHQSSIHNFWHEVRDTNAGEVDSLRKSKDIGADGAMASAKSGAGKEPSDGRLARRQRFLDGCQSLTSKHSDLVSFRVKATDTRRKTSYKSQVVATLEARFMERLETLLDKNPDLQLTGLRRDFEELRAARSNLQTEKQILDSHEGAVLQAEYELADLELRFYRFSPLPSEGSSDDGLDFDLRQRDPTETDVSSLNIRANTSPEARLYLSQMGKVDLLKERLMDMDIEYAQVVEEAAMREELDLSLEEASQVFLQNFEADREALAMRLNEAETALAALKEGLHDIDDRYSSVDTIADADSEFAEDEAQTEGASQDHSLSVKEDDLNDEIVQTGEVERAHLSATARLFLFSRAESRSVYPEAMVNSDGGNVNRTNYVNAWLLHRLRRSTAEVATLISVHNKNGFQLSPEQFNEQVLAWWTYKDATPNTHPPAGTSTCSIATDDGHDQ